VKSVARQVLRHRLITNFNARSQKVTISNLVENLLRDVKPLTDGEPPVLR
jgi:hypothetical protein